MNFADERRPRRPSARKPPRSPWFGLVAVGQIVFRKIDGHQEFLMQEQWYQAA